ncbi:M16 family metallopeptidase [Bacteroidota bacterium]
MKNYFLLIGLLFYGLNLFCQAPEALQVEVYELENGLTVYLNEDHNMPMVNGMVVVKGGAKRDPADATGIAHYFEHIMFKGTDKIGTIDFEAEKPYLDSIEDLYDELAETLDEDKRLEIQKEINRISMIAAEYAIPNELDKILSGMGGTNLNAGTGPEKIVYYNSFPSNQLEKWLEVYSHRFIHPVYRLFQSELETVYEEKNLYADDPFDRALEEYSKNFFRNTPYGQQTILGSIEHLKNPSLRKMGEYYHTYYVANNMALILAGDFDKESVKPLIKEKFGIWRKGPEIKETGFSEEPFNGKELVTVRMTPLKVGINGYRGVPRNNKDEIVLEVISSMLSNSASTGLLDELVNENKLMMAVAYPDPKTELGSFEIIYIPKIIGQSIKSAEELIDEQVNKLKSGDFDEDMLEGVKAEMKMYEETSLEDLRWRTYAISDAFVYGIEWEDLLKKSQMIDQVRKEDVVNAVNKYLGEDYLVFHSKIGFPKKEKIEKPQFKPVKSKNNESKSEYAKMIEEMPVTAMEPRFIDFNKDVITTRIAEGVRSFVTRNPINEVFSISIEYGKGTYNDPLVDPAIMLFSRAHPEGMTFKEFKNQLQILGCTIYAYSNLSSTTISIRGLEENLRESLSLVDRLLSNYTIDEDQMEFVLQGAQLDRKYEKKDISAKNDAIGQYARYGEKSSYLRRMTVKELKTLEVDQLVEKFREIMKYELDVHYCGIKTPDEFNKEFFKSIAFPDDLLETPGRIEMERTIYEENQIFVLTDKNARQSHINLYVEGEPNDRSGRVMMDGYNNYMGGDMGSLLFQEIREFRSLAYGVRGRYIPSFYIDRPGYFSGWLSTQSDKTLDALEIYDSLLFRLPRKPERMDLIRTNLTLSINADQPSFRSKTSVVSNWLEQGYDKDPREIRYPRYKEMEFNDIIDFYEQNVEGKPWVVTIVGDTRNIDMDELAAYGKIKMLSLDELMND